MIAGIVIVIGGAAVAISPTTFGFNRELQRRLGRQRQRALGRGQAVRRSPAPGLGSGSFEVEYHEHNPASGPLTASHTTPVTIAAEQGIIGELPYIALVVVALVVLVRGTRRDPARAAIAAAFVALLVHTMLLYADFLEDPATWALLAVGVALARAPKPQEATEAIPARALPAMSG